MTLDSAQQAAWQVQAARVLLVLLDRGYREGLPPLAWTVGETGASLVGRAHARQAVSAWAVALGVEVTEHRHESGMVTVTADGDRVETPRGWCRVALTADIWEEGGGDG